MFNSWFFVVFYRLEFYLIDLGFGIFDIEKYSHVYIINFLGLWNTRPIPIFRILFDIRAFLNRFSGIENNENFHAMAPESDEFFKSMWICRAATNASKYWEMFRSLPNNSVTSYYDQSHQSVRKWQNGIFFGSLVLSNNIIQNTIWEKNMGTKTV